ncbi:hypothetical protein CORC01_03221 [Colletotrichum orchidophilum]|uniref:Uncharacterized protein n=1 Tax=Colletotrichum orchidophilum TaxID=1209926 RepID=A0A1G4BJE0_9PEZI|nr:uncharacterized protein CORC01_03221 [Colletotrichum orchidophilum]OHF01465.1 hypothetical protein CORC01_03221 [Colletotrichum orchidophilum]
MPPVTLPPPWHSPRITSHWVPHAPLLTHFHPTSRLSPIGSCGHRNDDSIAWATQQAQHQPLDLPKQSPTNDMAPDLNSLPSSPPSLPIRSRMSSSNGEAPLPPASGGPAPRGESPAGSPRRQSTSLQAAATLNASLQSEPSRRMCVDERIRITLLIDQGSSSGSVSRNRQSPNAGRRLSTVLMNLQLNDPSLPGPGEMVADAQHGQSGGATTASQQPVGTSPMMVPGGDPHHNRAPSLGELHQELEAEQEAQVNRLLHMIRQQQLQLQHLQAGQGQSSSAVEDSAIASERSNQGTHISQQPSGFTPLPSSGSFSRSPVVPHPRSSFDMARADIQRRSRTPSRGASPRLRSTSISGDSGEQYTLGGRDESAFYQAETQMLVRENQMLRHRIRDLEKQLTDMLPATSTQGNPSEPAHPSQLRAAAVGDEDTTTPSITQGSSELAKEA